MDKNSIPDVVKSADLQTVSVRPMAHAEIESQIITAQNNPRSIKKFKDELMSLANLDQATAEGCYYALSRAGKSISGPSIRFAEIALSCYGNAVAQADVVDEDGKYVYACGMCRDLEKNVAVRMTVRRRITNKHGIRYGDDMIAVTANAACAIALRNAIFKIVPGAYTKEAFDKVKETAVGEAESFADRRAEVLLRLGKLGVGEERVLELLQRPSTEEITFNDVALLIGLGTAIHDGDTTLDEAFPAPVKGGVEGLKERLQEKEKPVEQPKGKGGRPKGSKNKKQDTPPGEPQEPTMSVEELESAASPENTQNEAGQTPDNAPKGEDKLLDVKYECRTCSNRFSEPERGKKDEPICPKCKSTDLQKEPVAPADEK